ncbi:MAG: tyrosine-protein phosphatase [Acidobacteria bacterium]|nr:tyrosine-protein phosphatase [Acidobacteriota bacterium]
MSFDRTPVRSLFASFFAIIVFSALAVAQSAPPPQQQDFSNVHIKNFGRMDERFYRGAEPKKREDFETLKGLGINTVVDLQAEPEPAEKAMVESLGMRYVNIPMIEKTYPRAEHVEAFLKLVDQPSTGKFFVHCAGGRHRTGVMGAVYRFSHYSWNYDQVYREMKQFDFYTRFGHGDFKKFVEDYWTQVQTDGTPAHTAFTHAALAHHATH